MKLVIGNDHAGVEFKNNLKKYLEEKGHTVLNVGTDTNDSVDYPDVAKLATDKILNGEAEYGILICGTGIGISIAANKVKGIRAALVSNELSAKLTRLHNDANVIAFGARIIGEELAKACLDSFLETEFEGGRHATRVNKIENGCGC